MVNSLVFLLAVTPVGFSFIDNSLCIVWSQQLPTLHFQRQETLTPLFIEVLEHSSKSPRRPSRRAYHHKVRRDTTTHIHPLHVGHPGQQTLQNHKREIQIHHPAQHLYVCAVPVLRCQ